MRTVTNQLHQLILSASMKHGSSFAYGVLASHGFTKLADVPVHERPAMVSAFERAILMPVRESPLQQRLAQLEDVP